ncbi:sortase-dependent protein [Streptomyces sp. NPDC091377]|uniref:sortase-dependent protein n=1 Tax=unclassified Streptomyces TaxID=2593676 RepID=UPI00380CDEDE
MRRTVLSAAALVCTAVLAISAPAWATAPTTGGSSDPTPSVSVPPSDEKTPTPSPTKPSPTDVGATPTVEPSAERPTPAPSTPPQDGQVSVVPSGAPDTGVLPTAGSGPAA